MSRRRNRSPPPPQTTKHHPVNSTTGTTSTLLFVDEHDPTKLAPPPLFINDDSYSQPLERSGFPALPYTSRRDQPKSAVHWGQRKLFLSELQLLTLILPDPLEPHWIIYVGSAPGQHLLFLDRLFGSVHEWELVDPGKFDNALRNVAETNNGGNNTRKKQQQQYASPKFTLRSEFFDNSAAYELMERRLCRASVPALSRVYRAFVGQHEEKQQQHQQEQTASAAAKARTTAGDEVNAARTEEIPIRNVAAATLPLGLGLLWRSAASKVKTLFISDVRSGNEDNDSFEEHVFENSLAQETWSDILQPTFAMLKFRLPYSFVRKQDTSVTPPRWVQVPGKFGEATHHLQGRVMLPLYARLTSTESRLIVREGAPRALYDHKSYEDQMFMFNSVLRECVLFVSPIVASSVDDEDDDENAEEQHRCELDRRFDGAAEAFVLNQYIQRVVPRLLRSNSFSPSFIAATASVEKLSVAISRQLHGTIAGAAQMCDDRLVQLAEKLPPAGQERARSAVQRAQAYRSLPVWRSDSLVAALSAAANKSPLWEARLRVLS